MTLTWLDIALPLGLAIVFGAFRYSQYLRTEPSAATQRAAMDAVKGAIGLTIITLGYKFITAP